LYAYPNRVTQKLLDTLAAHPRLCKNKDCRYSTQPQCAGAHEARFARTRFLKLLERIRTTIGWSFAAHVVHCGFRAETERILDELCDFVPRG